MTSLARRLPLSALMLFLLWTGAPVAAAEADPAVEEAVTKLRRADNEVDISIILGNLNAEQLLALSRTLYERKPSPADVDGAQYVHAETAIRFWARKAKPGTRGEAIGRVLLDGSAPSGWRDAFCENLGASPEDDVFRLSPEEWAQVETALVKVLSDANRSADARIAACRALVTRDSDDYEALLRKDGRLKEAFIRHGLEPQTAPDPWELAGKTEFTGELAAELAAHRERAHSHVELLMTLARNDKENDELRAEALQGLRAYHVRWTPEAAAIERFYFELYERRGALPPALRVKALGAVYSALQRRVRREAFEIANGRYDEAVKNEAAGLLRSLYLQRRQQE